MAWRAPERIAGRRRRGRTAKQQVGVKHTGDLGEAHERRDTHGQRVKRRRGRRAQTTDARKQLRLELAVVELRAPMTRWRE